MPLVLKIIAATAAMSVVFTIWLILMLTSRGFRPFENASALVVFTLVGWAVTLLLGPIAAVQLWRLKESGRIAGLILFGCGALYYLAGLLWLRSAEAATGQIVVAMISYILPIVVLALPSARRACS